MIQTQANFANAAIGSDNRILDDIHLKHKNIAIFQREFDPLNIGAVGVTKQTINFRASGTTEEVTSTLNTYFGHELPDHTRLLSDVLSLLGRFGEITKSSSFRLLLAAVHTNMCRKFHTDINDLRMLCTYVGPGTLWVPDKAMGHPVDQKGKGSEDVILNRRFIQQVNTGDVVILKGALYPDASPILHRSPTIEEHGEKRLLLRIDTNENLWT